MQTEGGKKKFAKMKQWLFEWSEEKFDEQYWKDLQEGKVDEKYWDKK